MAAPRPKPTIQPKQPEHQPSFDSLTSDEEEQNVAEEITHCESTFVSKDLLRNESRPDKQTTKNEKKNT